MVMRLKDMCATMTKAEFAKEFPVEFVSMVFKGTIKDIEFKGEDNMEVNFIEMMEDAWEKGTVYKNKAGTLFKVENGTLKCKVEGDKEFFKINEPSLYVVTSRYFKVEQYKEITAEEVVTAIRDEKEVMFDLKGNKYVLDRTAPMSVNTLLSTRFFIKE